MHFCDFDLPQHLRRSHARTSVGGLAHEPKLLKQGSIRVKRGVVRRQELVPVEDRVRPCLEHQVLLRVRERQPPGAQADHRPGHYDPGGGDHPGHVEGVDVRDAVRVDALVGVGISQRRPFHGDECVDRDALRVFRERGQDVQQAHAVRLLLAEPEDSPAADADSRLADVRDGLKSVLICPCGDNVRVVLRTCVEVVIVGGQAGILELTCLLGIQHAKCAADLEAHTIDPPDHV
mmetsp:Transcript_19259/g.45069  ORF Transcript_19259/g.45069 Transcript_19259/m.45069 type:complete len:234 (+) Transcript_19259:107-808(+)